MLRNNKSIGDIRAFTKKHERYMFPAMLLVGFIIDTFTLNRVDQWFDNIILLSYIALAGGCIIAMYGEPSFKKWKIYSKIEAFTPLVFLYAIGGLFSGLVVLYSKSGSLIVSFPFMIILITLFIGNEFFYKKYPRLVFQSLIFYIAIFSYSILITPVLVRSIGFFSFLIGTIISLAVMFGFIALMKLFIVEGYKIYKKRMYGGVILIAVVFSLLYVTNIIPPIPLSLKDISTHHSVTRQSDGAYTLVSEKSPLFSRNLFRETIHIKSGQPVYVFSSVFAPTTITATVIHEWSYFDEDKKRWITASEIPIKIAGGRDTGYRGYSYKSSVFTGLWRVDVKAKDGKLIGRQRFRIKEWTDKITLFSESK